MLLKKEMSRIELLKNLYQFEEIYRDALDDLEIRYILENYHIGNKEDYANYILNQFYQEFNLLDEKKNIYINLLKKLRETFNIDGKRILEIGGGPIPQFARLIAEEAESVTVMDPSITLMNGRDNIIIKQNYFLPYTDITNYDLVVASMACGTAKSIIHNCATNNKDFFILFCPCLNEDYNKIKAFAKFRLANSNIGELKEDKLIDQPDFDNPIIYNKRMILTNEKR